jgi:hypothetical protein
MMNVGLWRDVDAIGSENKVIFKILAKKGEKFQIYRSDILGGFYVSILASVFDYRPGRDV